MQRALRDALIAFIEDDVRVHELSRRIYLAPAERARRIRERRAWIAALRELPDDDETKGDTPCTVENS